jgi:hypothetical protein
MVYSDDDGRYDNLNVSENDGKHYISASFHDERNIEERITDTDWLRLSRDEVTLQDLAGKYFSFIKL